VTNRPEGRKSGSPPGPLCRLGNGCCRHELFVSECGRVINLLPYKVALMISAFFCPLTLHRLQLNFELLSF
jgi:hypothetical protein